MIYYERFKSIRNTDHMVGTSNVCTYHYVMSHLSSVEEYDKNVTMYRHIMGIVTLLSIAGIGRSKQNYYKLIAINLLHTLNFLNM